MYNAFGSRQVASIYTPTNDYQIILESQPEFQTDPSATCRASILKTATGASVPLESVTKIVPEVGPLLVNHQGSQPSVTISFNLAPGYSLGQAVDAIQEIEREARLPATISTGFQGRRRCSRILLKGQGVLVLAAIFASYVLLGVLYESFIHPITIISGLPSAGIGALLTLIAFRMDLSVIAMIGIVMLVGIVMKNAIMMIDFALERRRIGMTAEAAMREACSLALPADHDDDVCRDVRRAADRARHRRGRRTAPAAGRRRGRRPVPLATADALHHAGGLHLSRPGRPMLKRRLEPQLEEVDLPSGRRPWRRNSCRSYSEREAGAAAAGRLGLADC